MVSKEPSPSLAGPAHSKSAESKPPGAMTVRSVLLNRDSPDIESRLKRRRSRTHPHQVRFKDLEDGSGSSSGNGSGAAGAGARSGGGLAEHHSKRGGAEPRGWSDGQPSVVGAVRGDMEGTIEVVAAFLARAPPHPLTPGPTRRCWAPPPQPCSLTLPMTRRPCTSMAIQTSPCLKKGSKTPFPPRCLSQGDTVGVEGDDEQDSPEEGDFHNHVSASRPTAENGPLGPEHQVEQRVKSSRRRTEEKGGSGLPAGVTSSRHSCPPSLSLPSEACYCSSATCRGRSGRQGSGTPSLVRKRKQRLHRAISDPGKEYCTTTTQTDSPSPSPPPETAQLCTTQIQTDSPWPSPPPTNTELCTSRMQSPSPPPTNTKLCTTQMQSPSPPPTNTKLCTTQMQSVSPPPTNTKLCTTQIQTDSPSPPPTNTELCTTQIQTDSPWPSPPPTNTKPCTTHIRSVSPPPTNTKLCTTQMQADSPSPPPTSTKLCTTQIHMGSRDLSPPPSNIKLSTTKGQSESTGPSPLSSTANVCRTQVHSDSPWKIRPLSESLCTSQIQTDNPSPPHPPSHSLLCTTKIQADCPLPPPLIHEKQSTFNVQPESLGPSATPLFSEIRTTNIQLTSALLSAPPQATACTSPHKTEDHCPSTSPTVQPTQSQCGSDRASPPLNSLCTTQIEAVPPCASPHPAALPAQSHARCGRPPRVASPCAHTPNAVLPTVLPTPTETPPPLPPKKTAAACPSSVPTHPEFPARTPILLARAPKPTIPSSNPTATPPAPAPKDACTTKTVPPPMAPLNLASNTPSPSPATIPLPTVPAGPSLALTQLKASPIPSSSPTPPSVVDAHPIPYYTVLSPPTALCAAPAAPASMQTAASCSPNMSTTSNHYTAPSSTPTPALSPIPVSFTGSTPCTIVPNGPTSIPAPAPPPSTSLAFPPGASSYTLPPPATATFVTQTALSCTSISYYSSTHQASAPGPHTGHPPPYATLIQTVSHCSIPCQGISPHFHSAAVPPYSSPVPTLKSSTLSNVNPSATPTKAVPLYSSTFRAAPPYTPPSQAPSSAQDRRVSRLPPPPPPPPPYTPRKEGGHATPGRAPLLRAESSRSRGREREEEEDKPRSASPLLCARGGSLRRRAQTPPVQGPKGDQNQASVSPARACSKPTCLSSAQAQLGVLHKMLCSGARSGSPNSQHPLPAAGGCSGSGERSVPRCLTPSQADTLRQVQEILGGLVSGARCKLDPAKVTEKLLGPNGPLHDIRSLQTQLHSLEGVLETSQNTIKVLLDVIQDLEKKEAERDGRHSYRTGQDTENCGTCRDCACIIYSVEHDFRLQEGQVVRTWKVGDPPEGSPMSASTTPESTTPHQADSPLPARPPATTKKSKKKCFWFL